MHIGIIGTRGIPNNYGGFEQCAEYLAAGLVKRGFRVSVYNSHNHPYQEKEWKGVNIIHCYDPEYKWGTAGQFVYDLNCIRDARKRSFDIILQLGYTSSSIWGWLLPGRAVITTNMDGLEWKRSKYTGSVRRFLLYAEKLGVKYSDHLIADSVGIQDYLRNKYGQESTFIPYGAHLFNDSNAGVLKEYNIEPYNYDMLIARLEPENSIEVILDGVVQANTRRPFIVVGKYETAYGTYMKNKYSTNKNIRFVGGIYEIEKLNNLRYFSNLYFHGHTVGGTNPSLLEAMASDSWICAHDNPFNRYILGEDGLYFTTSGDVAKHLVQADYTDKSCREMIRNNRRKIADIYSWERIIEQYTNHFLEIKGDLKKEKQAAAVYQVTG
ncbi:MAG: DUF1972 domain-containing protein [Flavisolibacter sp.]|nr:DUF1972 domain-containing protein [Flavisolibacter sp.]MBD0287387.1 DUF1972 domain-containing protein [Flavisolibacter sp.]MBD0349718.1 DUF1972 domain-containing protein [Flavisolibacter sp.]MBD0374106.1 DUF1972 domain-containing protein [Flavisolibacter sp.]